MDLFNSNTAINILPYDGETIYYGKIFSSQQANSYLNILLNNIAWKNDEAVIFGKHIITKRKVAWYGNNDYDYTYSKISRRALPWTRELLELKTVTEKLAAEQFNSCLLNLYHNGNEGMAWHSDDEKTLSDHASIASLSFGAERKFSFKHKKSGQTISLILESGSLLIMKTGTQPHWLHSLPKSAKIDKPRINLTFRTMIL